MNKLLYITNLRLPTEKAYGIQIAKMCEAFANQGVHVNLIIPIRRNLSGKDIFDYYETKRNFGVVRLFSPDFYLPGRLDKVAFAIKNFISTAILFFYALFRKADTIFSRDELPLYFLSFFKRNLIFEAHKYSSHRLGYYRRFKKADLKIVAISKGIKDEFVRFGYKPERVLVAHDGVDLNQFVINKTKLECRKLLELPQDKTLVLYTGHLYEWKGAHVLAEAAKNLDERYVVVFVGGTENDVIQYKKNYFNYKNIIFLGWRPHNLMPTYLKAADILVLPNSGKEEISRLFTSPLKMFEYMASGKPIIASDLPSIREVLTEDIAFFSRPDDPNNLTFIINEVANNTLESEKRAKQALHKVAQYSWKVRAGQIIRFINNLA